MKKLLLPLLLLLANMSFSQNNNIKYFGGIYGNQLYFNWVIHNVDSCYYIIEISDDGEWYYEIKRDSIRPMPVAIMHGISIPACNPELSIRVVAKINGVILEYQPAIFREGFYTNIIEVKPRSGKTIYASF